MGHCRVVDLLGCLYVHLEVPEKILLTIYVWQQRTTSTQLDSNDPQDGNRILRNSSSGGTNNSFARVIDPDTSYTASGTRSATHHSPSLPSRGLEPSPEEAEDNLNLYKTQMMPSLPITIVSASISARRLHQDRPFLWLCIMAISTKSTEQQKALGREIRLSIGREMILEGKNNLDLLSGLITYTAWYTLFRQGYHWTLYRSDLLQGSFSHLRQSYHYHTHAACNRTSSQSRLEEVAAQRTTADDA